MYYVIAIVCGVIFGGADQYLGSLAALGAWTAAVSGMSAPWLVFPFAFGTTQTDRRRAMTLGLVATYAALLGYFAMTLSPLEGVSVARISLTGELRSQLHVLLPALVTGPMCGLCGHAWRTRRLWPAAALIAGSLCLEAPVRALAGRLTPAPAVWIAEVAAGLGLAAWFTARGITSAPRPDTRG